MDNDISLIQCDFQKVAGMPGKYGPYIEAFSMKQGRKLRIASWSPCTVEIHTIVAKRGPVRIYKIKAALSKLY